VLTWAELEAAAPDIALRGRELLDRFQFVLVGTLTKDGSPLILFGGNDPSSGLHSLQGLATIPEAAWELFLGVYCTVWGSPRFSICGPSSRGSASGVRPTRTLEKPTVNREPGPFLRKSV